MNTVTVTLPTLADCRVTVDAMPEHDDPRGFFATGDDEADRRHVEHIRAELDAGNLWAWCIVTVGVHWRGMTGRDTLGSCNYASQEDFTKAGGYFDDMKAEALADLHRQIQELAN